MKTKTGLIAAALALGIAAPMAMTAPAYAQCMHGERIDGTTADMARAKATSAGFSNVVMNRKGCDNYWHGTANQGGSRVGIVVSPAGQVMVESLLDQPPGMAGGVAYPASDSAPSISENRPYPQTITPGYPQTERAIPETQRAVPAYR